MTDVGGIAKLAAEINDYPDALHGDYTPAVHQLVKIGTAALPAVLPLLVSEDRLTRLHAQRVLEGVTRAWVQSRTVPVPPTRKDASAWLKLWQENGAYNWEADAAARGQAVSLWRQWLARIEA
jgi:hypothetical protein